MVRDDRFPIRVCTQYYNVTDTPDVPAEVFKSLSEKLDRVYRMVPEKDKGSLVVEKDTGRTTAHTVEKPTYVTPSVPKPWIW